jgi:flagellar biosynthetic protein FliQ
VTPDESMEIARQTVELILVLSLPTLLTALVIGLAISVLQAVTQVSEMTLTFIPKMIGVMVVLLLLLPWMMSKMMAYTEQILTRMGG